MGGGQAELKGPDFVKDGVAVAEVGEGAMMLGHAEGEAVLLVRTGGALRAIGATCSHYGGPLAEGLLVGDHVRCPWHHARFCVKNGHAHAPALNAVTSWKLEERGNRAYVTGKNKATPLPVHDATARASSPTSVVILGAGAAGNAAAEQLRSEGYDGAVTMVGADESVPVDRPNLSKDYLAGAAPEEWIPLRGKEFYAEKKITLALGVRAMKIDAKEKTVTLSTGSALSFDALLIATGADPRALAIPGADLPHVHTLRTLADSRAIIARAKSTKRAVVIGASFIGLEVAASLRTRGLEVHVVAPDAVPLGRILGKDVGALVRSVHEEHGVVFHLGDTPESITASGVTLKSGAVVEADLVVVGVGVTPALGLAEAAGLVMDRGVLVNEFLETSVPGIFAAGDVARYPDAQSRQMVRIEHWVVAERQGQTAARNILGQRQKYTDVPFFWSNHFDLGISYVGHSETWDVAHVAGSLTSRDAIVAYREHGTIRAIATIGRDHQSLEAEAALERGDDAALERLMLA
jgi:NADPH-dependent 2,4-dienoyl-CoA reductase/sulfur reductase-like enzyme/nitrite reductase/ring-hydroxylating ferredoxin subunit